MTAEIVPQIDQRVEGDFIVSDAYLVSARSPGCGSTTVAHMLADQFRRDGEPDVYSISIGQQVRGTAAREVDLRAAIAAGSVPTDVLPFDKIYYDHAARSGRIAIVEGKLATRVGPALLPGNTRITTVELACHPLVSATRMMRREGQSMIDYVNDPDAIVDFLRSVHDRSAQIASLSIPDSLEFDKDRVGRRLDFDTGQLRPEEVVAEIKGDESARAEVKRWELEALHGVLDDLRRLRATTNPHPLDSHHFDAILARVGYGVDRLTLNSNEFALQGLREDIRNGLIHGVHSMLMKGVPRFFHDKDGKIVIDTESRNWSPGYYKIANAWPTLKAMLEGKTVLDPYAGAGTYLNLLAARGIPKSVTYGDISYIGGHPINGGKYRYSPDLNKVMLTTLFDRLPSWYKPISAAMDRPTAYSTLNARNLPFADDSFDMVTGDPPYGIALRDGCVEDFVDGLPELLRVSREGCLMLIPVAWLPTLDKKGVIYSNLTGDLAHGHSDVATTFVHFRK